MASKEKNSTLTGEMDKKREGFSTPSTADAQSASLIIQLLTLPARKLPDWAESFVLVGVKEPEMLDLTKLPTSDEDASVFWHQNQKGDVTRPTGHEVLKSLVSAYMIGEDQKGMTYQVKPEDLINGHYGLRELNYLAENWNILPESFRVWAKTRGKLLYGHRDCVRDGNGYLSSPCLRCGVKVPCVRWSYLDGQWRDREPGLREQVGA